VVVMGSDTASYRPFIPPISKPGCWHQRVSILSRCPSRWTIRNSELAEAEPALRRRFYCIPQRREVAERNAPVSPAWNSTATLTASCRSHNAETISLNSALSILVPGTNVLAFQA